VPAPPQRLEGFSGLQYGGEAPDSSAGTVRMAVADCNLVLLAEGINDI